MSAATIQLFYWSDQVKAPAATAAAISANGNGIYVDPDTGFTFISPSVYIAFTSLGATDFCGAVGDVCAPTEHVQQASSRY